MEKTGYVTVAITKNLKRIVDIYLRRNLKPRIFNGPSYEPVLDDMRLKGQMLRIVELMIDGEWRSLNEINEETGDPPASISAQLRHLRKPRFGSHIVDKRRRGDDTTGLWEYRLILMEKKR